MMEDFAQLLPKSLLQNKESPEEKKAALEAAVKKKRECERKALAVVHFAVENQNVSSDWLIENAKYLNPAYYQDITEERALSKICGYPICNQKIVKVLKQQWKICSKGNILYDIAFRKNFCSDICYMASEHFKKQLPTVLLWVRDDMEMPKFTLSTSCKGLAGDPVVIIPIALPDEDEEEPAPQQPEIKLPRPSTTKPTVVASQPTLSPVETVIHYVKQWFNSQTLYWLRSEATVQQHIDPIGDVEEQLSDLSVNDLTQFNHVNRSVEKRNLAIVNVQAYMSGQSKLFETVPDEVREQLDDVKEIPEEDLVPVVMPVVDAKSQKRMRQTIVLDQVGRGYPRLAKALGLKLKFPQLQNQLNKLVCTFNLTADTITFRPTELPILVFTLIVILSRKNQEVLEDLQTANAQQVPFQTEILSFVKQLIDG